MATIERPQRFVEMADEKTRNGDAGIALQHRSGNPTLLPEMRDDVPQLGRHVRLHRAPRERAEMPVEALCEQIVDP